MKKILVDCTTLSKKTDGLTQYTLSIVLELLKNTCDIYILLCRKNELPENYISQLLAFGDKCSIEYAEIASIGPKRDIQFNSWYRKNKNRFDVFYEPSAQYPWGIKGGIYTVHDILYEKFPEKLGKRSCFKKIYLHKVVKRGIKKSDIVVAVSKFTKAEIIKYHGCIDFSDKIHVVYEGYEHLRNIVINRTDAYVQKKLAFDEKFFLYIGSSRGHKNLYNLFLAYEKSCVDWKLVVVGRMDRLEEREKKIVEIINNKSERIIFTGWIDDNQMYRIFSCASAFVFPSKSEGFGIPILEAFYFNIPLLCSDIPVFNEVAGNACIKFNPFDTDSIAYCLSKFTQASENEISELLKKQKKQLQQYSWKDTAKKIYKLFDTDNISNITNTCIGGG